MRPDSGFLEEEEEEEEGKGRGKEEVVVVWRRVLVVSMKLGDVLYNDF